MLLSSYFLGSNTRHGFHSLYGGFCPPEKGCFLHVIKGGPGCGKSSFMRRIGSAAELRGLEVEYVLCSGDPDSLDGVFIPALGIGYVDGTAPHVIDAAYPAGSAMYLDLGRFYDVGALRTENDRIMDINRRYKALYTAAYGQIAAGGALLSRHVPGLWGDAEKEKLLKKLRSFAQREFRSSVDGSGSVGECFLSAISCKGRIFLGDALRKSCERLCLLDNELGMGHFLLEQLLPMAREKGLDTVIARDCIEPALISAVLLPQLGLALVCSDSGIDTAGDIYRHLRLDAMADRETLAPHRHSLRRSKKLSRDCLALATDTLAEAKALHDELEAVYNPHVDFNGVYAEAERHIDMLL